MSEELKFNNIDYALVEENRPALYTAMKYWGKKPHNIWQHYIETYTPENGTCLDPFCGSGIAFFEAIKCNRKVVAFDINPISSFLIDVLTSSFDKENFKQTVKSIVDFVENDKIYNKIYKTKSRYSEDLATIQNFKWDNGKIYEIGILKTQNDKIKEKQYLSKPSQEDLEILEVIKNVEIQTPFPNEPFPNSPSFSANFIKNIGGNNFSNLWTKRNLYVISLIFSKIVKIEDKIIQNQLLFGFIQMLHLATKMCVPRREGANRAFSTSWGRSAYICSARQMEMNPLILFERNCCGKKQSVASALLSAKDYLDLKNLKIKQVSEANKDKNNLNFKAKYGVIDICSLDQFLPEKTIDFIMTDPPYGGLVQYLDLSYIWLSWLALIDKKYIPNFDAEITIKKGKIPLELYQKRFTFALKQLYKVLKDEGKIIFTFHNKEILIWNSFLHSITEAGFVIEKVIHQQNKRSGESVVANPYGTSGTDFYIRCIKNQNISLKTDKEEFNNLVLQVAIRLIAKRNEPTPYQILFNGILAEISMRGFILDDFNDSIEKVLKKHTQDIFLITDNKESKAGHLWWFQEPKKYITYPDRTLSNRVDETILSVLRTKHSITFDDILGEIFVRYQNGLTPDIKSINSYLKKYATQSGGKWTYNYNEIEPQISQHTKILKILSEIGKKLKKEIYIGKREQWEKIDNKKLSDYADFKELSLLNLENEKKERLEMIDMLWLANNQIETVIEVENSTDFTQALQRASNINKNIPKIMAIPNKREKELLNISDKLFKESFKDYNWSYILYSDIEKVLQSREQNINLFLKKLN